MMNTSTNIVWSSGESHCLLNPFLHTKNPEIIIDLLSDKLSNLPQNDSNQKPSHSEGHIWISSSGTTNSNPDKFKFVALSKKAFLIAAQSLNEHLQINEKDIWLNPLPKFHVGGQAIYARSYLSKCKVIETTGNNSKWNPNQFYQDLLSSKATVTSLVPTQLYDLIKKKLKSPKNLRLALISGAELTSNTYSQALQLGWSVLPGYGLSECCTQVATSSLNDLEKNLEVAKLPSDKLFAIPDFFLLNHIQAKLVEERLALKSDSLLSAYAFFDLSASDLFQKIRIENPLTNGWFLTQDRAEITDIPDSNDKIAPDHFQDKEITENVIIKFLGRSDDFIKVSGETVSLNTLRDSLQELLPKDFPPNLVHIFSRLDERRGQTICIAISEFAARTLDYAALLKKFNNTIIPVGKIKEIYFCQELPLNPLGKFQQGLLTQASSSFAMVEE